ncbi:MAG: hypothetical protein GY873_30345 [Bosea sp.]|uniref:hypothetical protein n=1 Tax=Bosea sp. (in: a-proteobacteria) TaxID=1871050 RepID=UPI0023929F6D|nr:hypothetical protein [Bosea sp. (in: a-proteobacteria)]MCP4738497.1 hypothetical protein [Bosea sp. (in: a-proteobacteria)]
MSAPALTLQDYDAVIIYLAECVVAHGERFAPFLDKMIAARDRLATRQDPVARARAILEEARRRPAP